MHSAAVPQKHVARLALYKHGWDLQDFLPGRHRYVVPLPPAAGVACQKPLAHAFEVQVAAGEKRKAAGVGARLV